MARRGFNPFFIFTIVLLTSDAQAAIHCVEVFDSRKTSYERTVFSSSDTTLSVSAQRLSVDTQFQYSSTNRIYRGETSRSASLGSLLSFLSGSRNFEPRSTEYKRILQKKLNAGVSIHEAIRETDREIAEKINQLLSILTNEQFREHQLAATHIIYQSLSPSNKVISELPEGMSPLVLNEARQLPAVSLASAISTKNFTAMAALDVAALFARSHRNKVGEQNVLTLIYDIQDKSRRGYLNREFDSVEYYLLSHVPIGDVQGIYILVPSKGTDHWIYLEIVDRETDNSARNIQIFDLGENLRVRNSNDNPIALLSKNKSRFEVTQVSSTTTNLLVFIYNFYQPTGTN